jgi:hypothetical protein
VNPFLVINCAASLINCQLPNAPHGIYSGQPVFIAFATPQSCADQGRKFDQNTAAKQLANVPTHSVCVEVTVDTHGGFDAPNASGSASLWVPVIAVTDAAASTADGPPSGMIPPIAFESNATCMAKLPKTDPGTMYPVCAKVDVLRIP